MKSAGEELMKELSKMSDSIPALKKALEEIANNKPPEEESHDGSRQKAGG